MKSELLLLCTVGLVDATYQTICSTTSSVCFSLSIPESTVSTGSGDVYLQIASDASKFSWVSLAQGTQMDGANFFVVYTSADGKNATLSTRQSHAEDAHRMPQHVDTVAAELTSGSGVHDGVLVANIKCSNCSSWSGHSMDFAASSTKWIWAFREGDSLNSDHKSATISFHSAFDNLEFGETAQSEDSAVEPFEIAACNAGNSKTLSESSSSSSSPSSIKASSTDLQTGTPSSTSSDASNSSETVTLTSLTPVIATMASDVEDAAQSRKKRAASSLTAEQMVRKAVGLSVCRSTSTDAAQTQLSAGGNSTTAERTTTTGSSSGATPPYILYMPVIVAHGFFACFAWSIFFPLGAIILRAVSPSSNLPVLKLHIAFQSFATVLYLVAGVLGIYLLVVGMESWRVSSHPILGLVIFALVPVQILLGQMHHRIFVKTHKRSSWSYGHLFLGPALVICGMVNGILGFYMKHAQTSDAAIAYYVITAFFFLAYVFFSLRDVLRKRRTPKESGSQKIPAISGRWRQGPGVSEMRQGSPAPYNRQQVRDWSSNNPTTALVAEHSSPTASFFPAESRMGSLESNTSEQFSSASRSVPVAYDHLQRASPAGSGPRTQPATYYGDARI